MNITPFHSLAYPLDGAAVNQAVLNTASAATTISCLDAGCGEGSTCVS